MKKLEMETVEKKVYVKRSFFAMQRALVPGANVGISFAYV